MHEYRSLGHMQAIDAASQQHGKINLIPHHPVFKTSSTTTKTRVVFDASCKTSNNRSLNDLLLVGPRIQSELSAIVLRWRKYPYAFTADIEKMYRQIIIHPDDQHYQCILWRDAEDMPITIYKLRTVTYGTACATHLAVRSLSQLAADHQNEAPAAARILLEDFYVDDVMSGAYTPSHVIKAQSQLQDLLLRGGLKLRKWASNHEPLLDQIPEQFREIQLPLDINSTYNINALGILWNPADDSFTFKLSLPDIALPATKRNILSDISRLFDPLGWVSPIIIRAKILMQAIWLKGVGWDDALDTSITQIWQELRHDLSNVNNIKIPRWIGFNNDNIEIHGFCDASQNAYADAIYARIKYSDNTFHSTLILAKTRVAPLKQITIPKLELCGAVLVANIVSRLESELKIDQLKVHFWTDSAIVLD